MVLARHRITSSFPTITSAISHKPVYGQLPDRRLYGPVTQVRVRVLRQQGSERAWSKVATLKEPDARSY